MGFQSKLHTYQNIATKINVHAGVNHPEQLNKSYCMQERLT